MDHDYSFSMDCPDDQNLAMRDLLVWALILATLPFAAPLVLVAGFLAGELRVD
jgi:hypothetical protein